jgi:hypothetical protein
VPLSYLVGYGIQGHSPEWRPLRDAVGDCLVESFMWMFEVRLARDGRAVHVYKHIDTRRCLHLDLAGGAYVYLGEKHYRRVALASTLEAVLRPWWEHLNATPEDIVASWAAIARAAGRDGPHHPRTRSSS